MLVAGTLQINALDRRINGSTAVVSGLTFASTVVDGLTGLDVTAAIVSAEWTVVSVVSTITDGLTVRIVLAPLVNRLAVAATVTADLDVEDRVVCFVMASDIAVPAAVAARVTTELLMAARFANLDNVTIVVSGLAVVLRLAVRAAVARLEVCLLGTYTVDVCLLVSTEVTIGVVEFEMETSEDFDKQLKT